MIKNQGGYLGFGGILTFFWQNSSSKCTFYRSNGVQFHEERLKNLEILQEMWKKVPPALVEKTPKRVKMTCFLLKIPSSKGIIRSK
jgi:hypothetical protein